MDQALHDAIAAVIPNCYGTVAPPEAVAPYAVWQRIGGDSSEYLDPADEPQVDKSQVQIRIFCTDVLEPKLKMRALTTALASHEWLVVRPMSGFRDDFDHDMSLFVAERDFEVIG